MTATSTLETLSLPRQITVSLLKTVFFYPGVDYKQELQLARLIYVSVLIHTSPETTALCNTMNTFAFTFVQLA